MFGGENVGKIEYESGINNKKLRADAKEADDIASKTGDNMGSSLEKGEGRASAALARLGKAAKVAAAATAVVLAGAMVKAAKASWDQVGAVEQATVGLRAYEKDGKKVDKVLAGLIKYARSDMGVLFNRKDLFQSAQMLKLNGVATGDLTKNVEILSRSVGLGLGNWQDLNSVVGRVVSTGRLSGIEFDQLTQYGYKLDKSLRNTNVSATDLFKALDKGIPVDAMKGQANTIRGIGIRLESAFRGIGDAILGVDADTSKFIEGGLGDRLVKGIGKATDTLKLLQPAITSTIPVLIEWFTKLWDKAGEIGEAVGDYLVPKFQALSNTVTKDLLPALQNFWKKVLQPMIPVIGTLFVSAVGLAIDQLNLWYNILTPVINFMADNEKIVWGFVAAFAAWKTAMLGKQAFNSAVSGIKLVKDAYETLAIKMMYAKDTFINMKEKLVDTAKMIAHAVKVGTAWVIESAKAATAWAIETAKMVARSSWAMLKMIPHAVDTALAWTINAARVSFVWVTQTMPKLVASFATTAVAASINAVKTSVAWGGAATRSTIAWVLAAPKMIASFALASAQAVIHAVKTGTAWVLSSTKAAVAWAVTTLPRIIGAFVVMSASAAKHAAMAAASWVASSVKATKSFVAFKALVATPMVMPAIAVGAALASLYMVLRAAQSVRAAVQQAIDLSNNEKRLSNIQGDMRKKAFGMINSGNATKAARGRKLLSDLSNINRFSGGPVSANKPYFVGENRDGSLNKTSELFVPKSAGRIVNSKDLQEALSGGSSSGIENNIGTINIGNEVDGEAWLRRLTNDQEIVSKGMTPQRSYV